MRNHNRCRFPARSRARRCLLLGKFLSFASDAQQLVGGSAWQHLEPLGFTCDEIDAAARVQQQLVSACVGKQTAKHARLSKAFCHIDRNPNTRDHPND